MKKKIALVFALLLAAGAGVVTVRYVSRSTPPPAKTSAAARALAPLAGEAEAVREPEPETTLPATPVPRRNHAYRTWGNVPGATVALQLRYYGGTPDPAPIERVADADGYAGFDPPPRDEPLHDASLRIRADGYLDQAREVEGDTTRYELAALSDFVSVLGRVTDGSGAPVEGARVGATRTDAAGCYRLLAYKPGLQRIMVTHPEFLPVKRSVDAPSDGIDFVLQRGLSVSGRVVARDGTPLPGVYLEAGRDRAWSGSDGRFRISGLEPGEVQIRVHVANMAQPGASGQSWRVLTVAAGDSDVEFRISEPVALLRVVDSAGLAFRHAKATVGLSKSGFGGRTNTLDLGTPGSLTTILDFGWNVHLTATAPGYALAEREFDAGDEPVREVVLTLQRPEATGSLEIQATDMDRRPRSFVLLSLRTHAGAPVEGYHDMRIPLDEEGRARVDGIVPGRYRVGIAAVPMFRSVRGYGLPCTFDVEVRPRESSPVEARIARGGRIRVTVRDAAGRIASPGSIELHRVDSSARHYALFCVEKEGAAGILVSDRTERVPLITARPIEPGRYRVVMKRAGEKVTEGEVDVEAGKTADLVLYVDE